MQTGIQNQLNMVAAVLAVLDTAASRAVWENLPPVVFTAKAAELRGANEAALLLAQRQTRPTTGAAEDNSGSETVLEERIIEESGLLASYYTDRGDAAGLAAVSASRSAVRGLPNQELLSLGNNIADLAEPLSQGAPAPGEDYGITAGSVARLREAAASFAAHLGQPAGVRAARKQLTHDLRLAVNGLLKLLDNMDNFLPRFRARPGGEAFLGAWNNARQVVDLGHRFEKPEAPVPAAVSG